MKWLTLNYKTKSIIKNIIFIMRQEYLNDDLKRLYQKLGTNIVL